MSWLTEQLGMDKKPWGGTLPKWEDYSEIGRAHV